MFNLMRMSGSSNAFEGSTWSATDKNANIILSNGNLTAVGSVSGGQVNVRGTLGMDAGGLGIAELLIDAMDGNGMSVGVAQATESLSGLATTADITWFSSTALTSALYGGGTAYGTAYAATVKVGVKLENGSLTFYRNGVSQGVAKTGMTGVWYLFATLSGSGGDQVTIRTALSYPYA